MTLSPDVAALNPHLNKSVLKRARVKGDPDPKRFENKLIEQLAERGIEQPMREVKFCIHGRQWRFDLCWQEQRVAVEVDGGTWSGGRHNRGAGFKEDCIKLNHAAREGWKVLRFPTDMVTDGSAAEFIAETLDEIGTEVLKF
jgi:very-short-patch-repair endonuclease